MHRWVKADWKRIERTGTDARHAERFYRVVRDFLKAAERAWEETWGSGSYLVTSSVTLKAMIRVCAALAAVDAEPEDGRLSRWQARLAPWGEMKRQFRAEGFYERFPAKGQVERVARVSRELARAAGIAPVATPESAKDARS
jgi:hypothetical protein